MFNTVLKCSADFGAGLAGGAKGPNILAQAIDALEPSKIVDVPIDKPKQQLRNHGILSQPEASILLGKNVVQSMRLLGRGDYPLLALTGDHSQAAWVAAGFRKTFSRGRIGMVWIDAHADCHSPWTTPSGNIHGMPIALMTADNNHANAKRMVEKEIVTKWQNLQAIAADVDLNPRHLVYIGVRYTEQEEDAWMRENRLHSFSTLESNGDPALVAKKTLHHLKDCEYIYISFDVDSLDSDIAPGTGTPVADGLTLRSAGLLLAYLLKSDKLRVLEISEFNPTLDEDKRTETNLKKLMRTFELI